MYGWIETGGFFVNTIESDIVFRTAGSSQAIAIGNAVLGESNVAGLYVRGNNVGIKCEPLITTSLSVKGSSVFFDGVLDVFDVLDSNLGYISNSGNALNFISSTHSNASSCYIDTKDSRLKTESIVAKNIFSEQRVLQNVMILDIRFNSSFEDGTALYQAYDLDIPIAMSEFFTDNTFFVINQRTFVVLQVLPNDNVTVLSLRIKQNSEFSSYNDVPFMSGDNVDITILEDWNPTNSAANLELLYYKFVVDSYEFLDVEAREGVTDSLRPNSRLHLKVYFRNRFHVLRENLEVYSLHSFTTSFSAMSLKKPDTILRLLKITKYQHENGQEAYDMLFDTLDGVTNLVTKGFANILGPIEQKTIYMSPLTNPAPPRVVENDVIVGYTIDAISQRLCYQIIGTRLAAMTPLYDSASMMKGYGVDTIKLGERTEKIAKLHYRYTDPDTVIVDTFGVDDDVFSVSRQTIEYVLRGINLHVLGILQVAVDSIELAVRSIQTNLLDNIQLYQGHYMYIMDNFYPDAMLFNCHKFYYDDVANVYKLALSCASAEAIAFVQDARFSIEERYIFVVPLKYTEHVRIGDAAYNTYIPHTMTIGTYKVREALTVNGNASFVNDVNLYNGHDSAIRENHFKIAYTNSRVLNLDDKLKIGNSNINMHLPLEVMGNVTASDFLKYSDVRLKKNILTASPRVDLERVVKLEVKTFNMVGKGEKRSKGVIAQEVMELFPDAIESYEKIIPIRYDQIAYYDRDTKRLRLCMLNKEVNNIKKGDWLRVGPVNDSNKTKWNHIDVTVKDLEVTNIKTIDVLSTDHYMSIYVEEEIPDIFVKIIGVVNRVFLVNYDVLYMSSINAIKALNQDVAVLSNELASLKNAHASPS